RLVYIQSDKNLFCSILFIIFSTFLRNLEGDVALRSSAAVYTYCKSRGLFAGVSLEGTCLIERKETNSKFYGRDIRASAILFGDISPPLQAQDLYDILESFTLQYEVEEGRSYSSAPVAKEPRKNYVKQQPSRTPQNIPPEAPRTSNRLYPELPKNYTAIENSKFNPTIVTAIYPFQGQQPGDLTFNPGDKIKVTTKTDSQFDWWEGSLHGKTGIFPANYVTLN
uniref:SH3 domain-containing YSC84-like protein 1 n=1 Tax=Laticauda laticaudata TaxID=8630 RepID=A0A8C5SC23_LATLA